MEYTQLINRILEAERNAQGIAAEVHKREIRMEEELEQETAQLNAAIQARAQERVSAIAKEAAASQLAAIQAQDKRKADVMERMERAYRLYGDNWVDTLFHRIVDVRP